MTIYLVEIKSELKKVLQAIQKNRALLSLSEFPKTASFDSQVITVENLEDLACNHLFDDKPGLFGITELEGNKIRAYFQEGSISYDFVPELRRAFPNVFERERREYLDRINEFRANKELGPISL